MQITAQHCDASPVKRILIEAEGLHRPHRHLLINAGVGLATTVFRRPWKSSSAVVTLALAWETPQNTTFGYNFLLYGKK